MNELINPKDCTTIGNYVKQSGKTRTTIERWIKEKKLTEIKIDGVKFIIKN